MITREQIKKNLSETVKNCGYNQKELAAMLNCSRQNINNIAVGYSLPSIEILANLCEALDVSADEILGLKKNYY